MMRVLKGFLSRIIVGQLNTILKPWKVDSETAIDTFLQGRKIEYSATDGVDTAMKDLLALFKQLGTPVSQLSF